MARVLFMVGAGYNFFPTTLSRQVLGLTQPPVQWILGAISQRMWQTGHASDHQHNIIMSMSRLVHAHLFYTFILWFLAIGTTSFFF
jgi:hypothetical protein